MTERRQIVVAIGGGIAAFKSASIVSTLVQQGHNVNVVLTKGATQFVGAATFSALCNQPPVVDSYDSRFPLGPHIELAEGADLIVVAPATARILASCAHGLADDLLATLYLCCKSPVLFAPAMSSSMWAKPSVMRNVQQLKDDGAHFVGPEAGWLSCRKQGEGRMSEPNLILKSIETILLSSESA